MNWIPIEKYEQSDEWTVLAKSGTEVLVGYCYWSDYDDRWNCQSEDKCLESVTHFIPIEELLNLPEL